MKKILVALVVIAALVVVAVVVLVGNLGAVIRGAVEKFGSDATKTKVTLAEADVSLTSGQGSLRGLVIPNPAGFSDATAFELGEVSLRIDPASVTTDTIVVKEVVIQGPKIRYEIDAKLSSNLGRIQENVDAYSRSLGGGGGAPKPQPTPEEAPKSGGGEKKLVIENLYVRGGVVSLGTAASAAGASCPLPEIHLKDIGKKSGGATAGEVTTQVLTAITNGSLRAAAENGLAKSAKGVIDSAVDKVKDIFK